MENFDTRDNLKARLGGMLSPDNIYVVEGTVPVLI